MKQQSHASSKCSVKISVSNQKRPDNKHKQKINKNPSSNTLKPVLANLSKDSLSPFAARGQHQTFEPELLPDSEAEIQELQLAPATTAHYQLERGLAKG